MPTEQETFDLYFRATLTGILANPEIINAVSQIAALNGTKGQQVREQITACAYDYACIAMKLRTAERPPAPYQP